MKRIMFICHGNICRSPMAEFVMRWLAEQEGIALETSSCATSREEIGEDIHVGTKRKLSEMGVPFSPRKAVQLTAHDYDRYDYLVVMDEKNYQNVMRIIGDDPGGKCKLLLSFADESRAIADPWYTGDFDQTFLDIEKGCRALLRKLRENR